MKKRRLVVIMIIFLFTLSCKNEDKDINLDIPAKVTQKAFNLKNNVLDDLKLKDSFQIKSALYSLRNLQYQKNLDGPRIETYSNLIDQYYQNQDTLLFKIKKVDISLPLEEQSFESLLLGHTNQNRTGASEQYWHSYFPARKSF